MRLQRPAALVLLASVALVAGACSSAASQAPAAGSGGPAGATRITVKLSDTLKIDPAAFNVPVGTPVTFVVTNTGAIDHEFFVGDDKAQADHDKEMSGQMAMTMDEPTGIGLKPGQTRELTITFKDPAAVFAGCHVSGHYAAGMKAAITVQ